LKRKGVIGFKLYKNTIIEGGVSLFKNDKVKTTIISNENKKPASCECDDKETGYAGPG